MFPNTAKPHPCLRGRWGGESRVGVQVPSNNTDASRAPGPVRLYL